MRIDDGLEKCLMNEESAVKCISEMFSKDSDMKHEFDSAMINNNKEDVCEICKYATEVLSFLLRLNSSEEVIWPVLQHFCPYVTPFDDHMCFLAGAAYLPALWEAIMRGLITPEVDICGLLGFCAPTRDLYSVEFPKEKPPHVVPTPPAPTGKRLNILQITDVHIDFKYAANSQEQHCFSTLCCHEWNGAGDSGYYGSYHCDLSNKYFDDLMDDLVVKIQLGIIPHPDIIFYGGDNTDHEIFNQTFEIDYINVMNYIHDSIVVRFPDIPLFYALGNHDVYPASLLRDYVDSASIDRMSYVAKTWGQDWSQFDRGFFLKTGSYSQQFHNFKIISPNLIFWMYSNFLSFGLENNGNPFGLFDWLVNELQESEDKGEKVWIFGHVPPSLWNLQSQPYRNYNRILARYEDTITLAIYGHCHNDQLMFMYNDTLGRATTGVSYISPGLTTYLELNPAVRIFEMDVDTGFPNEVLTYVSDLTTDNQAKKVDLKLSYLMKEEYDMINLLPSEWEVWHSRVLQKDSDIQKKYLKNWYNSSGNDKDCGDICVQQALCQSRNMMLEDYMICVAGGPEIH